METCQTQLKLYLAVFDLSQGTDFKKMKELSNVYMQWIFIYMTLSDRSFSSFSDLSEHSHLYYDTGRKLFIVNLHVLFRLFSP